MVWWVAVRLGLYGWKGRARGTMGDLEDMEGGCV